MRVINREIAQGNAIVYGGPEEQGYCDEFVQFMGGGYADAVNSGTNAVYVALRSLDLEPFTEIIVPPITNQGGVMPVALLNCVPVPADSAPGSLNTSVNQIEAVVSDRTSAILVAHIAGHPVDMDPILELARERSLPVVEDCAQAHGARYKGSLVGTLGAVAAISTMFEKQHATGAQGGVVYTRNPDIFIRAKQVADRGKPFGVADRHRYMTAALNLNQDEISMAIGRVQLAKLPRTLIARNRFARLVRDAVRGIEGIEMDTDPPYCESSYYFLMLRLDPKSLACTTGEFASALEQEGIGGVSEGYLFFPTDHPWYQDRVVFGTSELPWSNTKNRDLGRHQFPLRNARAANENCVRINIHENLGVREADDLRQALKKLIQYFSRDRRS